MTLQFTPEDLDRLIAAVGLTFSKRAVALLDEVPIENTDPRATDAANRAEITSRLIDKVERDYPLPSWRELI